MQGTQKIDTSYYLIYHRDIPVFSALNFLVSLKS